MLRYLGLLGEWIVLNSFSEGGDRLSKVSEKLDQTINRHFSYRVLLITVSEIDLAILLFNLSDDSHIIYLSNLSISNLFIYGSFRKINLNNLN